MNTAGVNATQKAGLPRRTEGILPVVLFLCFTIAAAVGLYALSYLRTVLVSERGRELAMNAGGVADTLDRIMFERFGDIQLFANDGVLQKGTAGEKTARLLQYKQRYWYYSWVGVTDENGQLIAATEALPSQGLSQLNPASFELARATGRVQFEDMRPSSKVRTELAIGFTAPIYGSQGEFRGAVVTRVPFENLRTVFEQEGRLRYGDIAYDWLLLDREGTVLSEKSPSPATDAGLVKLRLPSLDKAADDRHRPGVIEEVHHRRGVAVVTGYAWTSGYADFRGFDWLVLFRMDHDQIYAPVDRLVWMVGGIGLLVVLPLTGYGIWVSWKLGCERNDLVKAQHELEQSVVELGRSNADLQQFAYVASHDLQEPLRMVSSYTQLLARRYKGKLDADADEFIAFAVNGANRMQRLIQDLLAYSRVSRGSRQGELTSVEAALNYALDNLRNAAHESGAMVTHDPLPTVTGDEKQLAQLLQNLLSNALKFRGPEPPRIHVSAERVDEEWLFSIRDNGIGLDPQYADRIFVIFQRLHNRQDYPGTGIGLAICKKIVERHGGRIWVASEPGKGATFYFTIRNCEQDHDTDQ
ncbi:MAG: putative Sensor histidine kinase with region [Nitrospira sp.]|jgi:signal transduction histidine kinase|nr:putative Sensor histidine kinase with region [Nitrospira sp.]